MRHPWVMLLLATACNAAAVDTNRGDGKAPGRTRPQSTAREELKPGRALAELAALPWPLASLPGLVAAAQAPAPLVVGGVPVQVVRAIYDGQDGGRPILLLDTGATDEAGTRRDLARLATDPLVRRVEPDRVRGRAGTPNDPLFGKQWGMSQIQMPRAWDRTVGMASVVVAVLDTGVLPDHPDLRSRLIAGYDFISDPASAADGTTRDPDPTDTGSSEFGSSGLHGTHVAGIIGAESNNGRGVAGVDWRCRIMPVRVLGVDRGTGVDSDIADAIRWSVKRQVGTLPLSAEKAAVINMSFGGLGISFTVQRAVDEIIAEGAIVVAAAGNGNADASGFSPGGLDGVISVGASTFERRRASYSNYGPRVDLLAPGGDDLSTPDGGIEVGVLSTYRELGDREGMGPFTYYGLLGTSQAAPHVSGAAALARSLAPGLQQLTMATLLRESADHKARCDQEEDGGCGAGLLNVDNLLAFTTAQTNCVPACKGDRYCFIGRCIDPGYPHTSIFADPVVHGGCQIGGGAPAGGAWLALGCAGLLFVRRARRPTLDKKGPGSRELDPA